ncbi:MAG: Gfo/Idh/MocA family oxidoreductase [Pelobacteraceae bacterium]
MKSNEDSYDSCVRVGILGWSDIARRKFVPALLQSDQTRFVALASRRSGQGTSLVPGTSAVMMTYEELINHPAVDLVYISLPNNLHEEWSVAALAHGKHVLCEKPLGLSTASVNRMLDAADRNGKLLYENLMYLQHPQHEAVRAIISSGRIGRVRSLRSEFAFPGPADGDFRLDAAMGGGAFHDLNRYPLSAALFFLEGKDHRFVRGSTEVRDGLTISLQAESGTEAGESFSFLVSFGQQYRSFYEITGERGNIRVERAYTTPADMENRIAVTVNGSDESFTVPPSDHFLGTIDHVCALIQSGAWEVEHERSRKLAELAGMFQDNCTKG